MGTIKRLMLQCAALPLVVWCGCSVYRTPGRGADFSLFADQDIEAILVRRPAARPPVNLATVRIQEPGYHSRTARGVGSGNYSVVTVRDVEREEDLQRLAELQHVDQVAPMNRLLVNERLESIEPLRRAAAALHADLLLIYTFDTEFYVGDMFTPLTVISLGISPNKSVRVTCTASAVVLDVRTAYVYGACETTARREQLASAWTSQSAVDSSRLKAERQAYEQLLGELEKLWPAVVNATQPMPN